MNKRNEVNRRTHAEVVINELEVIDDLVLTRIKKAEFSITELESLGRGDLAAPVRSEVMGLRHVSGLILARIKAINEGGIV